MEVQTVIASDKDMLKSFYDLADQEELSMLPRLSNWLLRIRLSR
jgi:DNA-directed RNA polymerase II subunit RPB1